jgi:pimeloyl-ACP methyl ester carboxylesterase
MGFAAAAGLDKPVALGASMSGEICLELAYRHPESFVERDGKRHRKIREKVRVVRGRCARDGVLVGETSLAVRTQYQFGGGCANDRNGAYASDVSV